MGSNDWLTNFMFGMINEADKMKSDHIRKQIIKLKSNTNKRKNKMSVNLKQILKDYENLLTDIMSSSKTSISSILKEGE